MVHSMNPNQHGKSPSTTKGPSSVTKNTTMPKIGTKMKGRNDKGTRSK